MAESGMFVSPLAIELGDLNITPLQQWAFVVKEISPLALVTLRSVEGCFSVRSVPRVCVCVK